MKLFIQAALRAAFLFLRGTRVLRHRFFGQQIFVFSFLSLKNAGQIFLLLSLFPSFAFSEEIHELEEVKVTAPFPASTEKPSAFVSVIDPKPYQYQIKTLPEILSTQPGVQVQQYGGLGQFSTMTLRGSSAEQVTVFLDGVKLNSAQGGAVDFSTLPLEMIDRIEVIRGAGSAQFGSDAIGGVVQIRTKKARKKQSGEWVVGGGSFGTFKARGGYARQFEKFSILLDHTHLQSKGDYAFRPTPIQIGSTPYGSLRTLKRENNAFFSENGLIRLEVNPSTSLHLSLTSNWFGSQREVAPTEEEAVLLTPANPLEAKEALLNNITTLRAEWKSVEGLPLHLNFQPYYHFERDHFRDPSPALGGAIDVLTHNHAIGGKIEAVGYVKTGFIQHELRGAYDLKTDLFNDENLLTQQPLAGAHHRLTHAGFVSDEMSFLNERLFVQPALRLEHTNDFGSRLGLNLGARAEIQPWIFLKANLGNAFRYPNFNELYFPNQGIVRGNPDLKPESSLNFDSGVSFLHRYGRHEVSYFKNWVENSILFVPISTYTIAPINSQKAKLQGLEFANTLFLGPHLDLDFNYTWISAHLDGSGHQLPGRPKHKINLKATLKNSWGSLELSGQYTDRLPLDFQNTAFITSRLQLDLTGSVQFLKHYFVSAQIKNLTNAQMLDARGFPLPRISAFGSVGVRL